MNRSSGGTNAGHEGANGSVGAAVSGLYDALPYPARNAEDERSRLIGTWLDDLRMVNHHCFRGARRFDGPVRVLVAGGGTGDGTLFLAEQLRHAADAEVVHLDVSSGALAVARDRARMRGLANITFVHGSLLDLPAVAPGRYDYINCVGVLHHLADPEAGLDALLGVLADDGALALLLYAKYGRTGVYQMQDLLRRLMPDVPALPARIALARDVLAAMPATNWFARGEDLHHDHEAGGDAGLADLLLHPQDRAYGVDELYTWLQDRCGLQLVLSDWHRGRLPYEGEPWLAAAPEPLRRAFAARSPRERHAIAELMVGDLITHSLFAHRAGGGPAPYGDPDFVPFLLNDAVTGADLAGLIDAHGHAPFMLRHAQSRLERALDPGRHVGAIFRHLDGQRTFGAIFARVRADAVHAGRPAPDDAALFAEFAPWYEALSAIERLLLRRTDAYAGIGGFEVRRP